MFKLTQPSVSPKKVPAILMLCSVRLWYYCQIKWHHRQSAESADHYYQGKNAHFFRLKPCWIQDLANFKYMTSKKNQQYSVSLRNLARVRYLQENKPDLRTAHQARICIDLSRNSNSNRGQSWQGGKHSRLVRVSFPGTRKIPSILR
mmetsp:Transcript_48292/g.100911  ORF Transcript_48292/g.100911 Transcript_48292/m.100911 type:complete len:147 (-) Transcript_48292:82-522(-)